MERLRGLIRALLAEPRRLQILVPASLLVYGTTALDFVLSPWAVPITIATAVGLELLLFRFRRAKDRPRPPIESALITSLSTLLLFRSTEAWAYAAVVAIAIASKVILRVKGRHFINPSNGAVLLGSLLFPGWIASGQWGHDVVLVFALAGVAALILARAGRLDSAFAYLGGAFVCQALRVEVLGYRWEEVAHRFTDGALWLFALYMITDPRTTPTARWARIAHGVLVAVFGTALAQFYWVRDDFLWALLALSPTVPLFDWISARLANREVTRPQGALIHDPAPASTR
jgi:Na+-transporting NADH:ubiquinone oxidoreductase subunit NqrB